jgi:malate dehydrogenase
VSIVADSITFSDPEFHKREATLLGSRNATVEDFDTVVKAMRAGQIPDRALNTHRLALSDVPAQFATLLADLLAANAEIFKTQGHALNEVALRDVKVLVVGNPANTNAYIAMKSSPDLPSENFSSMIRLDHNRALSQLAAYLGCGTPALAQMAVWGNHSPTMFPDYRFVTRDGQALIQSEAVKQWNREQFIPTVAQRGTAVIEARGHSSAASAANAAIDQMRDWVRGSNGQWVSMGIPSDGSYGIPEGLMFGVPVLCKEGHYERVTSLELTGFARDKIDLSVKELVAELDAIAHLLA